MTKSFPRDSDTIGSSKPGSNTAKSGAEEHTRTWKPFKSAPLSSLKSTLITLCVAALGAGGARLLFLPIPDLTGPAIFVSIAGLLGLKTDLHPFFRNIAFIVLGMSMGSGMNSETAQMLFRLPMAFAAVVLSTLLGLFACWIVLVQVFNFSKRSGLLAATPGHLSFVLSMGAQYNLDLSQIAIVQSIRLLSLTLLTPLAALLLGFTLPDTLSSSDKTMTIQVIILLALLAYIASLGLKRIKAPAPLLIGAMLVSMIGHGSDLTTGAMPNWLALPAFVVLGAMIGTRFSGVSLRQLGQAALAGVAATIITGFTAFSTAILMALLLSLPVSEMLIAFAPGGLETMVAMSVSMDLNSGFVAACHLARLLALSVMIPVLFARTTKEKEARSYRASECDD